MRSAVDELAVREGCYFEESAGLYVVEFFSRFLRHSKGRWAGQPFDLLDWERDEVVMPLFGWKRPDGSRRFRQAYIEVPKKNGKSTLLAGFGLFGLIADHEPGAEVYSAGADRQQASIIHSESSRMVRKSPGLRQRLICVDSQKRIVYPEQDAVFVALSADAYSNDGWNAHMILFDELHAQKTPDLWDTLIYATIAREQPLHISITTAGISRLGICWEQHEYAQGVLDATIPDTSFLAVIHAADVDDDWTSPEVWAKANPSYGITIDPVEIASACRAAQASPRKENVFRRLRLNQWVEQDTRWVSMSTWDACNTAPLDPEDLEGRSCYAGIDMSSTQDLSAEALVFPPVDEDEPWKVLVYLWLPADNMVERVRKDKVPYDLWVRQGFIETTQGNVIDYDVIRRRTSELNERFRILEIAIDRWNATQLSTQLMGDGFDVVLFGQGFASMSGPTKEMEKLVLSKMLDHGGHPVLRWMMSHAVVETDAAENIKLSKKKSTERIDGLIATVMGLGRAIVQTTDEESVYESQGIKSL